MTKQQALDHIQDVARQAQQFGVANIDFKRFQQAVDVLKQGAGR